jgi:hypothetical protein
MRQDISGLQEAQAACLMLLAAMRPSGALGKAVQFGLATASRLAIVSTAVDTGAWRASHRTELNGLRGEISIDPSARNPRNNALVSVYSAALAKKKGGRYDVYKSVYQQQATIAAGAAQSLIAELPQ